MLDGLGIRNLIGDRLDHARARAADGGVRSRPRSRSRRTLAAPGSAPTPPGTRNARRDAPTGEGSVGGAACGPRWGVAIALGSDGGRGSSLRWRRLRACGRRARGVGLWTALVFGSEGWDRPPSRPLDAAPHANPAPIPEPCRAVHEEYGAQYATARTWRRVVAPCTISVTLSTHPGTNSPETRMGRRKCHVALTTPSPGSVYRGDRRPGDHEGLRLEGSERAALCIATPGAPTPANAPKPAAAAPRPVLTAPSMYPATQ